MLTLYTDSSPNGFKATIALEELGLPYTLKHVHINQGEHRQPDFLRLNPHGRIPVLTDDETGITLFESAAILLYGRENRPPAARRTARPLASHAMAHLPRRQRRPLIGQRVHFEIFAAHKDPIAIERYRRLTHEAYATLDQHLASGQPFRRRRIQHRRHRPLRLDPYRPPHRLRLRRLPASERLARTHRPQTRRAARHHAPGARHRGMSRPTRSACAPPLKGHACGPRMSLPEALTRSPGACLRTGKAGSAASGWRMHGSSSS